MLLQPRDVTPTSRGILRLFDNWISPQRTQRGIRCIPERHRSSTLTAPGLGLVVRPAAMVLGAAETRLPGVDQQSLPHGSSPGPRLDASNQGAVRPVAES